MAEEKVNVVIQMIPKLIELIITFGGKLLVAIAIFLIGKWVARLLSNVLKRALGRSKMDATVVQYMGNLAYGVILIFVVIAAIARLGVQTAYFVAIFGAATLAIGMALQGTLGNFSAGIMLLIFRPFKVGDWVDVAGFSGKIEDIGMFATVILPTDGRKITVPNGALAGGAITNYSAVPVRVVEIPIDVPATHDIAKVQDLMVQTLLSGEAVMKDPAPRTVITAASAASFSLLLSASVQNEDYNRAKADLLEKVRAALIANEIWA
jgi:small conductance mechanosensitive channel